MLLHQSLLMLHVIKLPNNGCFKTCNAIFFLKMPNQINSKKKILLLLFLIKCTGKGSIAILMYYYYYYYESDMMVTHTLNLCSAFNPSWCTHTHTVNTHPEQWAAIYDAANFFVDFKLFLKKNYTETIQNLV